MATTIDVTLKQGDTLIADCTYRDAQGVPVNLDSAGITIKSTVRSADGSGRYPLEVTPQNQSVRPGEFRLRGNTTGWKPLGDLLWDIRYYRGEDSFSSRTLRIRLLESIT